MEQTGLPPRAFVWKAHEPDLISEPYTTVRAAVMYILRPVRSWDLLTTQMLASRLPASWEEFSSRVADLATQVSYAVVAAPHGSTDQHLKGPATDVTGRQLWIWSPAECDRVLDWLFSFFRARLENRLEAAVSTRGAAEATALCNELASWFHIRHFPSPADGRKTVSDLPEAPSVPEPPVSRAALAYFSACQEPLGPLVPVPSTANTYVSVVFGYRRLNEGYRGGRKLVGLNGYEAKGWSRFVSAIDEGKTQVFLEEERSATVRTDMLAGPESGLFTPEISEVGGPIDGPHGNTDATTTSENLSLSERRVLAICKALLEHVAEHHSPPDFHGRTVEGFLIWCGDAIGTSPTTVRNALTDVRIIGDDRKSGATGKALPGRLRRLLDFAAEKSAELRTQVLEVEDVVLAEF